MLLILWCYFYVWGVSRTTITSLALLHLNYIQLYSLVKLSVYPFFVLFGLFKISFINPIIMPFECNGDIYNMNILFVLMPCLGIILFNRMTQI